jgi:outer membrane protein assembly factor BamB
MHRAITLALAMVSCAAAADWPRWRGATGDARWNPETCPADVGDSEPKRLWRMEVGKGYGGVTVAQGLVYLMDRQTQPAERERVLCVDTAKGNLLWAHEWPVSYGKMGGYATGPRASVCVHDGKAYALGATGLAVCLEAKTGQVLWQRDLVKEESAEVPQWGFAASPFIHEGKLLLHVGGVTALDPASGKTLWHGGKDSAGYSTPEIFRHGQRDIIAQWGPNMIELLDASSGEQLWSHPYKITYGVSIAQPLVADGLLMVSGYWHGTKTFRLGATLAETKLVWEEEKRLCGLMSAPLYRQGIAYLLDKSQGLSAVELSSGKILWQDGNMLTPADRNPQLSMVWLKESAGLVAMLNANGELLYVTLSAEKAEEHARHQVIGKTWAHPAFVGSQLFARSDTELCGWQLW